MVGVFILLISFLAVALGSVDPNSIETVHVVFANHLDVGFNAHLNYSAGLAIDVINAYFDVYYPEALRMIEQVPKQPGNKTFLYTTHSFLVAIYLNCSLYQDSFARMGEQLGHAWNRTAFPYGPLHCPSQQSVTAFLRAINLGQITWHAFPFNAQLGLLDRNAIMLGVELTHKLDTALGKPLVRTLSQRDVPGMTIGAVSALLRSGVQAVSVGVNQASAPPAVPSAFVWKASNRQASDGDESILAMWHPGGYGGTTLQDCVTVPNLPHALAFAFNGDNRGPGNIQWIMQQFQDLQEAFPKANVIASTFDAFVTELQKVRDTLPVVDLEIGDTWIYGAASDPWKVQVMREMMRFTQHLPTTSLYDMFFLKSAEHTWGLDNKRFLIDWANWSNADFGKTRNQPNVKLMEKSWNEQRAYLNAAIEQLNAPDRNDLLKSIQALKPLPNGPDLTGYTYIPQFHNEISCGNWTIQFSPSGALQKLRNEILRKDYASPDSVLGEYIYNSYDSSDFSQFLSEYVYDPSASWAIYDFGKPNLTAGKPVKGEWTGSLTGAWGKQDANACRYFLRLDWDDKPHRLGGAPQLIWTHLEIPLSGKQTKLKNGAKGAFGVHAGAAIRFSFHVYNKTATRLPEAHWVKFQPLLRNTSVKDTWLISTCAGLSIDLRRIVTNGSTHLHGSDGGVSYLNANTGDQFQVSSMDVPLISIGSPNAFPTPLKTLGDPEQGIYFNIFNNLYDTNYILWYPWLANDSYIFSRFELSL